MKAIKKIEKVVLSILEKDVKARKDDYYLYKEVLETVVDTSKITLKEFLENFNKFEIKLPSWKSVERCRRHIQALRTDLQESKTAIKRQDAEIDYKLYNLTGIGN